MEAIADGYICTDCILMIANGELDPDASDERIEEVAQATAAWSLASDDEHPPLEFSTAACRCCRDRHYGAREWAVKFGR
jgi:hypothetical protein